RATRINSPAPFRQPSARAESFAAAAPPHTTTTCLAQPTRAVSHLTIGGDHRSQAPVSGHAAFEIEAARIGPDVSIDDVHAGAVRALAGTAIGIYQNTPAAIESALRRGRARGERDPDEA